MGSRRAAPEAARTLAQGGLEAAGQRFEKLDEGAVRLLERLGRFLPDENLEIRRYGLRTAFPEEVLAAADAAARRGFDRADRLDLTGEPMLTIDATHARWTTGSPTARSPTGARLGIHIADPGAFDSRGPRGPEALLRYHALPFRMASAMLGAGREAASLLAGRPRSPSSWRWPDGAIRGGGWCARWCAPRATPADEADLALASGEDLGRRCCAAGRRRRPSGAARGRGAVRILARVDVRVQDGVPALERLPADSPSRRLVAEAMVQAGAAAARFCLERGVPAIYRRQAPPTGAIPEGSQPITDPVRVRQVRRLLRRAEVGIQPGAHAGLGLPAYAQATSPLRRYQDLATNRQIAAVLAAGVPAHDPLALQRIAATTERAEAEGRRAERASGPTGCSATWKRAWGGGGGTVVEVDPSPPSSSSTRRCSRSACRRWPVFPRGPRPPPRGAGERPGGAAVPA